MMVPDWEPVRHAFIRRKFTLNSSVRLFILGVEYKSCCYGLSSGCQNHVASKWCHRGSRGPLNWSFEVSSAWPQWFYFHDFCPLDVLISSVTFWSPTSCSLWVPRFGPREIAMLLGTCPLFRKGSIYLSYIHTKVFRRYVGWRKPK